MVCDIVREVRPWEAAPYSLVSWWDMEQFSAKGFFNAGSLIEQIKNECLMASMDIDPTAPIYNLAATLEPGLRGRAGDYLQKIERECRSIGLAISADTAKATSEKLQAADSLASVSRLLNYQWLRDKLSDLHSLMCREMKNHGFFYISPEKSRYWPKVDDRNTFGDEVADAFGSCYFDAKNAGICIAIGLGTASVFHSMRVLEIGLTAFAAVFDIKTAHTNWEPVLREVESKIREMHKDPVWKALPDCKTKQERYSQAASHFAVLKDAWRNYTMHARGTHGDDEAILIFLNVKGFMQKLASLGLKEQP